MSALDKLTPDDTQALREYATLCNCGVRWKGHLKWGWATGVYRHATPTIRAQLQDMRNRLGTSWLTKFKF